MVDGQESDEEVATVQPVTGPTPARSPARDAALIGQREAPDGEEGEAPALLAPVAGSPIGQTLAAPLVSSENIEGRSFLPGSCHKRQKPQAPTNP